MARSLQVLLALVVLAPVAFAAVPPAPLPPSGGGNVDPWVDAGGDVLYGGLRWASDMNALVLDLNGNYLSFGGLDYLIGEDGVLYFADDMVCTDGNVFDCTGMPQSCDDGDGLYWDGGSFSWDCDSDAHGVGKPTLPQCEFGDIIRTDPNGWWTCSREEFELLSLEGACEEGEVFAFTAGVWDCAPVPAGPQGPAGPAGAQAPRALKVQRDRSRASRARKGRPQARSRRTARRRARASKRPSGRAAPRASRCAGSRAGAASTASKSNPPSGSPARRAPPFAALTRKATARATP